MCVRYEIALYLNDDPQPCAAGHFVHVHAERGSNRTEPISTAVRQVLATNLAPESTAGNRISLLRAAITSATALRTVAQDKESRMGAGVTMASEAAVPIA